MDIKTLIFIHDLLKKEVDNTKSMLDYAVMCVAELDVNPDDSAKSRLEYANSCHTKAVEALAVFESLKWV